MKKFFKTITAALLVLSFAGCTNAVQTDNNQLNSDNNDSNTVKIAYIPITHALALFEEAEELEENTGLDIELVKYGSWPELLDALNTGRVAMKSKEQGINIKTVALGHKDGNVIVVSNNINGVEDLKGKTFAIPHRQSSHNILLNDALQSAGLTASDINITELAPTEMPSALAGGQIDGYCVAEPFGAKAVSFGVGKVLFSSEELWPDSLCCGLVFTDNFITGRPEIVKQLLDSYKTAGKNLSVDKAKEVAKKYLNQDDDVLDISLKWISYDELDITKDTYNTLVEKVKKYGLSDNPPKYEEFIKNNL